MEKMQLQKTKSYSYVLCNGPAGLSLAFVRKDGRLAFLGEDIIEQLKALKSKGEYDSRGDQILEITDDYPKDRNARRLYAPFHGKIISIRSHGCVNPDRVTEDMIEIYDRLRLHQQPVPEDYVEDYVCTTRIWSDEDPDFD